MTSMDTDNILGSIDLNRSSRLVFSVGLWKGKTLANVRKFVETRKFTGFTQSGLAMTPGVLVEVIAVLQRLLGYTPKAQQEEFARVTKNDSTNIVIALVTPDDIKSLPKVDIREFVDSPEYTGYTPKGVRFSLDKLQEVISLFQLQADKLRAISQNQPALFKGAEPTWVKKAEEVKDTNTLSSDEVHQGILSGTAKDFPEEFLDRTKLKKEKVKLPDDTLELALVQGGRHVVRSKFGFEYEVQNPVVGKYMIYAHMRGHRSLSLPKEMIDIFKAVKAYENYIRQLRDTFLQEYERKSGHKPIAEHKTKQVFKTHGLPWIEHS